MTKVTQKDLRTSILAVTLAATLFLSTMANTAYATEIGDTAKMNLHGNVLCDTTSGTENCGKSMAKFDLTVYDVDYGSSCSGDMKGNLIIALNSSDYKGVILLTNFGSMHFTIDAKGNMSIKGKMVDSNGDVVLVEGFGSSHTQSPEISKFVLTLDVDNIETEHVILDMSGTSIVLCDNTDP